MNGHGPRGGIVERENMVDDRANFDETLLVVNSDEGGSGDDVNRGPDDIVVRARENDRRRLVWGPDQATFPVGGGIVGS